MAEWDSDSDSDMDPIGASIHGQNKTLLSEQSFRFIIIFMVILIAIAATLAFIFSLLTWLELEGEINITAKVVDRLLDMASLLGGSA